MIGLELIAAKEECEHGDWLPWLKENFGWGHATASNFMNVANAFGSKFPPGGNLDGFSIDAKALYLLSAPAIPQEVRDEAVEKKTLTLKEAEALVAWRQWKCLPNADLVCFCTSIARISASVLPAPAQSST